MPFEAAEQVEQGTAAMPAAGCCGGGVAAPQRPGADAAARFVRADGTGRSRIDLMVPSIHCPACIGTLERGLAAQPGIHSARVNLTAKRVAVVFDPEALNPSSILSAVTDLGHEARAYDAAAMAALERDAAGRDLLARIGVAGFAMMNVM
ncbi:MAG: cation transporter, partial [Pseudomonadota bacterium]